MLYCELVFYYFTSLPPSLSSPSLCLSPGVRYYMRGIDDDGFAANFVETEQIINYEGHTSSFVQVKIIVHLNLHSLYCSVTFWQRY